MHRAYALIAALAVASSGCGGGGGTFAPVEIDDPDVFYASSLPVPLTIPDPVDARGALAVDVRLFLPDHARVDVDDAGRLVLPPGARIDRVERWRAPDDTWRIADVRGARVATDGALLFHVLRPRGPRAPTLFGAEFTALDDAGERAAHAHVVEHMREGEGFAWRAAGALRARAIETFETLGACNACHTPLKPEERRVDARLTDGTVAVHRATGAQGFYSLDALFHDDGPVEDHRPVSPALAHPFMTFTCGDDVVVAPPAARCDDGGVLRARLDVKSALAHDDAHARAVCDARRAIAARMTDAARAAVQDALTVCGG